MQVPAGMISQHFELTKEENQQKQQFDNYCKQYMNGNYKYKRYMLEENDSKPSAFIVEDEMGYEVRITTPYGVEKEILHEMKNNNIIQKSSLKLQAKNGKRLNKMQATDNF